MDLNTVEAVIRPGMRSELPAWRPGDAWLGGGTWLFSEPQPALHRLVDLAGLGWAPLTVTEAGLTIAATCTIAELNRFTPPAAWTAAGLIGPCCRALLGSFKIWNLATVGGNLCLALPAGPMIALTAALDGTCTLWTPEGDERPLSVLDFVRGPQETALRPGEILRSITLPTAALTRRAASRRISLTPGGRSGAFVIGTRDADGTFALTITAAVRRPVRIAFPRMPDEGDLRAALDEAITDATLFDDIHGAPAWRRHMTGAFALAIRDELAREGVS
ncbi:FAD-binding molybdopterin dehydrogenase [Methylobacterium sp. Leaf123]|uniref:FAD binding domain-containing protein n=1 Tax=Methylobacterium sp. Leaf123 TaxID=1736264 RepID=UPI0006F8E9BC|nr:FAD binding domain-containing protein [Methylobacterium sp. Leaf123]KQQ14290.1 FAD-binding molybdopterin dehydrogenase [Methylobacterium sp. Leaf123]